MVSIVKNNHGRVQQFDTSKLYQSILRACLSVRTPEGEAQVTAQRVFADIEPWLQSKHEITSSDIRRKTAERLKVYNPHAAYQYGGHISNSHQTPGSLGGPTTPNASAQSLHPSWLDIGKQGHWD